MSTVMDADTFVKKAKDAAKNYKTLYVLGCFGAPMTGTNKNRYIFHSNKYNKSSARSKKIIAATTDTFGFDCVCLLKGLFWGWCGDKNKVYGGAYYPSKNHPSEVPDVGANTMFDKYCTGKSANFKNIVPGEFVWMSGHIGVYIGDGLAVECTPIWKDGVQITAVGNIGKKSGYNTRTWTKHGKSVFLNYSSKPEPKPTPTPKPTAIKPGDSVIVNGRGYATSKATGSVTKEFKNKKMRVIAIANNCYACNQYNEGKAGDYSKVTAWFKASAVRKV